MVWNTRSRTSRVRSPLRVISRWISLVTVGEATKTDASLTVNSGYVTKITLIKGAVSVPASSTANIYEVGATDAAVGTISVAGGTIGTATATNAVLSNASRNVDVTISGGEFVAKEGATVSNTTERNYITGGTFTPGITADDTVDKAAADVALNTTYATVTSGTDKYTVVGKAAVEAEASELKSGDTISVQQGDAAFTGVPAGVKVLNPGTGTVTVDNTEVDEDGTKYVARIGGKNYESLVAAVEAAVNGDTITLLDNINMVTEASGVTFKKNLTIDLNKKVITVSTGKSLTFVRFPPSP